MADDFLTVADLVADAFDLADIQVSDLLNQAPLVARLPVEESSNGTTHKYPKETGAPVVGFRDPNVGRDIDSSVDTIVTATLEILDFSWKVDKAVADVWRKGREQLIAREGFRHLRAAMFAFEQQLIRGTNASADGFDGFEDAATLDALADPMVVNAAGTTASTGSSVYGIRVGVDDCVGVYNGDEPFSLGDTTVVDAVDGTGKHYPAYYTPGCTWLGLQLGSIYSIGRICNLTADSGKGLTDDLLAELLSRYPAGRGPTHFVMNRRSLKQLQQSRTATNVTGAPAPFPTEAFGVPIVTTDAIVSTEALLT